MTQPRPHTHTPFRPLLLSTTLLTIILFITDIITGTTLITPTQILTTLLHPQADPTLHTIIIHIRLTKALTALLAGAALSISGLQMQTLFQNPLAGPYVLGISSGASLGVAIFILGAPLLSLTPAIIPLGIAGAAWIGAAAILLLIITISRHIRDIMVILILGIMFSSATAAIVQILQYLTSKEALQAYIIWTMGSLADVTTPQLLLLIPAITAGTIIALATTKQMNTLQLGTDYARTLGINIPRTRLLLILSTTLLAGTITAFCGPIGFIGLAIPHIARTITHTADHRHLLPITLTTGASTMLLCDIISKTLTLPINAITALIGIPIIIWIVITYSRPR